MRKERWRRDDIILTIDSFVFLIDVRRWLTEKNIDEKKQNILLLLLLLFIDVDHHLLDDGDDDDDDDDDIFLDILKRIYPRLIDEKTLLLIIWSIFSVDQFVGEIDFSISSSFDDVLFIITSVVKTKERFLFFFFFLLSSSWI